MATTKTPATKKPAARKPAAKKPAAAKKAAAPKAAAKVTPVERAVNVPLGATLVASDAVTETVDSLRSALGSTDSLGKELQLRRKRLEAEVQRFERRGATARTRIEKDLKGRRTRLEKDLKAGRSTAEQLVQKSVERVSDRVASVR